MWRYDVCKTEIFHGFEEVCRHEERFSKYPPIILSGKKSDGSSRGRFRNVAIPSYGDAMDITDTSNSNYDIITTVSARQHSAMGGSGAGVKAQGKVRFINVGL